MTAGAAKLPYKTLEPPPPKPLVTVLVGLTMVLMTYMAASASKFDWIAKSAFTAGHMADLLRANDFGGLLSMMSYASMVQFSVWIWPFNAFFLWVFGYVVEKRLKSLHYMVLVAIIMVTGWVAVYTQAIATPSKMYVGPSMMLFGLLGAYFAYFPKRENKIQQWTKNPTEIFRNEKEPTTEERYWVSPWMYVIAFVAYQILLQVCLNVDKDVIIERTHMSFLGPAHNYLFGKLEVFPSAFQPVAAIINIGVGYAVASVLPMFTVAVKPKRPGGKLQLVVIQHYKELRTLDMTHDQACEGAAKFASVPLDIARDWIAKGAAGLKDQDVL